jgi:GTP-binding protein HflX
VTLKRVGRQQPDSSVAADAAETAILIGVGFGAEPVRVTDLAELSALASSAGVIPVQELVCRRARPDPALCIGSGKAQEIGEIIQAHSIRLAIFDRALTPIQQRNLTRLWDIPVFDRTELILEIFAQRARSSEGMLQVELARIEHQMTRLVRSWSHLERQRGGIGQRGGPGEKQIELDRRMLDVKARQLRERLQKLHRQRQTRRRARERRSAFTVSLVGYTNAGKSTLFNALTGAQTYAADQLFATLDTLTRRLALPDRSEVVVSDTVGFVRALPHTLIEAFAATLQETAQADLLLHVVDAARDDRDQQIDEVNRVLASIGAGDVARITVYNKCDLAGREPTVEFDPCGTIDRVWLSARTGAGVEALKAALAERRAGLIDALSASGSEPHAEARRANFFLE